MYPAIVYKSKKVGRYIIKGDNKMDGETWRRRLEGGEHIESIYLGFGRARLSSVELPTDFSVVLFRPNFMLVSEDHPVKMHKN